MNRTNLHRDIIIIAVALAIFLIWKLSSLQFRFADENTYFYMAKAALDGLIPYRDFFFADPPLFLYIMAGFKALFGSHILLFKTLPVLFDGMSAILLYLIVRKEHPFAVLAPIFYLFSFTVLATSDYLTGAEFVIFFMLVALYLDQKEKYYGAGIFWAFAGLCKLYIGPALLGVLFYKLITKQFTAIRKIILGGFVTTLAIVLPFFLLAPGQMFSDTIIHHFNKPAGLNKVAIFKVFLKFEWLLILSTAAYAFIAGNRRYLFPLLFSAVFFLIYKDLYYLYLHLLLPFIAILVAGFVEYLNKKQPEFAWTFILFFIFTSVYSVNGYIDPYRKEGVFENPSEIAETLKNAPEDLPVYGANEAAPLLALLAGKKIFDNKIDTNIQSFAAGSQDMQAISEKAAKSGIYFLARNAYYPEQKIHRMGFEKYFSKEIFESSCVQVKTFERKVLNDPLNTVDIYKCKME